MPQYWGGGAGAWQGGGGASGWGCGREGEGRYLVSGPGVALQSRSKVCDVSGYLLNHEPPHLIVPDCLRGVKLAQKCLAELLGPCTSDTTQPPPPAPSGPHPLLPVNSAREVLDLRTMVLQETDHGLGQQLSQDAALHDVRRALRGNSHNRKKSHIYIQVR